MTKNQTPESNRLNGVAEYYFSSKLREIEKLNSNGANVVNLGIGSPDLAPPDSALEELTKSLQISGQSRYQSYRGIPHLREAFATWYKEFFNVGLDPDNEVLPLIGSKEGIMHVSMAFINQDDLVLVPNPGYPAYAASTKLAGGNLKEYKLSVENGWKLDIEKLREFDLSRVKLIWVNYPHMPTGASVDRKFFLELTKFAEEHKIIIVNDNPYAFILNEEPCSILNNEIRSDWILELNSLSKSHNMAGWRVGAVMGSSVLIDTILKFKSNMDSGMFLPVQLAAAKALTEGWDWYEKLNAEYKLRRSFAHQIFDHLGCSYSRTAKGLFVWALIPENRASAEAYSDFILSNAKVFITPGHIFGSQGEKYLRISLTSPIPDWETALHRIIKTIVYRKSKISEKA